MKPPVIHQKAFLNKACLSGRESAHIVCTEITGEKHKSAIRRNDL